MSLQPQAISIIPEETARIAHCAFRKSNVCLRLRDELGTLYDDPLLAALFSMRG